MYLADPAHSSFNAAENILGRDNAGVLEAAWTLGVSGRLAAAATVVDGVLYFGDWGGQFHAVDAETGRTLWTQFVGMAAPPEDPGCQPAIGVTAQAAIAGNTVYVGGGDSAVYALDRATGRVEWRTALADPRTGSYLWSSITPYAGALYIGVASLGDCPLVRGALVRIDLARPDRPLVRYLYPADEQGGGIWSTPAIDEASGSVYVTTGTGEQDAAEGRWGGTFAALDANTLEMRAHYLLPSNSLENDIEWGSSPALFTLPDGTRLVAATGKDGVLYALRAGDLAVAWTSTIAVGCICPECGCGSLSTPAWDGQTLYVGAGNSDPESFSAGTVYAIDPENGEVRWRRETEGVVIAPVTVANGLVYAGTSEGLLVFDSATGERLWDDGGRGVMYSQPVVVDGTVYCTYFGGEVVAWRAPAPVVSGG